MRDAIGWSYDLLDENERAVFRRLSIFAGAFTMDAVEVVAGGRDAVAVDPEFDALEVIASLVDKSLLRQGEAPDGEPTYVLLETVREFGLEQLADSGEADELGRRHAAWYLSLAERAAPELLGPDQRQWVERLDRDLPNLRAALEWMIEHGEPERALQLAGTLSSFWFLRGHLREGTEWLDQALAQAPNAPPATRSWAFFSAGMLRWAAGDFSQANAIGDRALSHAREHHIVFGEATALYLLFLVSLAQRQRDQAVTLGERALSRMREAGNRAWLAYVLGDVGLELIIAGDLDRGAAMIEEGLALHRELGNKQGVGNKLSDLGILKHDAGDEVGATRDYAESLRLLWEGGDTWYIATPVAGLAAIAMSAGNAEQASRLIGAATALRARSGGALWPNEQARFEQTVTAARAALGDEAYAREVATGQALPLADVIAEAAAVAGTQPGAESRASPPLPSAN
jgi:tetratricopeptide (TPR) repeat protein